MDTTAFIHHITSLQWTNKEQSPLLCRPSIGHSFVHKTQLKQSLQSHSEHDNVTRQRINMCDNPSTKTYKETSEQTKNGGSLITRIIYRISSIFTLLFPVWTLLAGLLGICYPDAFVMVTDSRVIEFCLSMLMLSMGLTLTSSDLSVAARRPSPLIFSLICCYGLVPLLSIILARVFQLNFATAAGLTLLGIISGGQASNLCTEIARGDTALSVAMTTLSTILAPLALPILSSILLSTRIDVPLMGLAISTTKLVLLPIFIGVVCNSLAPKITKSAKPFLPPFGIISLLALVAGPCAKSAHIFRQGSYLPLLLPVLLLHILSGIGGFILAKLGNTNRATATALAFETGFKSPALAYVLACRHFVQEEVRLASAVSIVVLAPLAALIAVILRIITKTKQSEKLLTNVDVEWISLQNMIDERKFRIYYIDGKMKIVEYKSLNAELNRAKRKGLSILSIEEIKLS